MNRHTKRAAKANPDVSVKLLQERVHNLEAEGAQMRNVLFALVRQLGRVRITEAEMAALTEGDSLNAEKVGDTYVISFKPATMVVPGGVKNGQPGAA